MLDTLNALLLKKDTASLSSTSFSVSEVDEELDALDPSWDDFEWGKCVHIIHHVAHRTSPPSFSIGHKHCLSLAPTVR